MDSMAGQLINRGKNIWLVRVFLGRDVNGKRKYHNKTIHGNKKAAQTYLNKILLEKDTGEFYEPNKEILSVYMDKWLKTAVKNRVTEKTFSGYKEIVKLYINPALGDALLSKLTVIQIQEFYNNLTGRGLSSQTVRHVHKILKNALEQAIKWQLLKQNPAQLVDLPKHKKVQEIRPLTQVEVKFFLENAIYNRWGIVFEVLLATGLRPSEALGLTWQDIDFEKYLLHVRKALTQGEEGWKLEEPKTKQSKRTIPLPAIVIQNLAAHKKNQTAEQLQAIEYNNHNLVFAANNGNPLNLRNLVRRHFKPLLKNAGLPDIRLYDLRHTCATLLMAAGENAKVVSERLGHTTTRMTLDTYTHVLSGMQQTATDKLAAIMFGETGSEQTKNIEKTT